MMNILLENFPHDIHNHISDMLRPKEWAHAESKMKINPFAKAPDIATIITLHRNFNKVPLWKNFEWSERIRKWSDENLTKMRWKYGFGQLGDEMIKKGWESKINNDYRHQGCYVETTLMEGIGPYYGQLKEIKIIWFEVSLKNLITGDRPLPHCFGNDGRADMRENGAKFEFTHKFVPAPSLLTRLPKSKRYDWLIECFKECVLDYWGEKIGGESSDFMKEFKKMMGLPSEYELSNAQLFKKFLEELQVQSMSAPTMSFPTLS